MSFRKIMSAALAATLLTACAGSPPPPASPQPEPELAAVEKRVKNSYGAYVGRRSYRYHFLDNGRLWIVPSC